MLQVDNQTPFAASLSVFPDPEGVETAYAVVKAAFRLGEAEPQPIVPALPLLATDVFWGDPATTSLRAAGEFALLKPATDVLLVGRAIAPRSGTRVAEVHLQVGPVQRTVRVFGDRHWRRSGGGWRASDPAEWDRMPLRWELAFGGVGQPASEGEPPEFEARNPVGRGFLGRKQSPQEGQPLPNLEDPAHPITDPHDRPPPCGLGPIPPTWQPRRGFAGTYDEAWTRQRAPYLPGDFDTRFFQVAPPGLIAPGFLQGGEPVLLAGVTAGGPVRFTLPDPGLQACWHVGGGVQAAPLSLETVMLEPDLGRLQLLWRTALRVDKRLAQVARFRVESRVWQRDGRARAPLNTLGRLPAGYAAA